MERMNFSFLKDVWKINSKDKQSLIWTMSTDFVLHIGRWFNLVKKLLEMKSDLDKLSISRYFFNKHTNNQLRYKLKIYEENIPKKLIFDNLSFGNASQEKKYFLDNKFKEKAESTIRQFFLIGSSIGLIYSINDDATTFLFNKNALTKEWCENFDWVTNETECLKTSIWLFEKIVDKSFKLSGSKITCFRDILLSIFFAFSIAKYGINDLIKYLLNDEVKHIKFRNKSNILTLVSKENVSLIQQLSKHAKDQTTIKKNINNDILEKFIFLIRETFIEHYSKNLTWKAINQTQHEVILNILDFSKSTTNRKTTHQQDFRKRLSFAYKRLNDDSTFSAHDILTTIKSHTLTEACHIFSYKDFHDKSQAYDPENGLLLDPTIHCYFDKNIIVFDDDGKIYVLRNYFKEVSKILAKDLISLKTCQIKPEILTSETKNYIRLKNKQQNIKFDDYFQLTK